jgi:hypothetical protein
MRELAANWPWVPGHTNRGAQALLGSLAGFGSGSTAGPLWPEKGAGRLGRLLGGWANYFCLGPVTATYRRVTAHVGHRLQQWLWRKYRVRGSGGSRFPDHYLYTVLGLLRLQRRPAGFSRA